MSEIDFLSRGNLDLVRNFYVHESAYGDEDVFELTVDGTPLNPYLVTADDILIMLHWMVYGRSKFMPLESLELANRLKKWIGDSE